LEDRSEELAASRYVSLLQTSDGYEIHRHGRATVETYPPTDEGFDAAWDRYGELTRVGRSGRRLTALIIVGVIAAVLWFVVTLIDAVLYAAAFDDRSNDGLNRLVAWLSPFTTVLYALFAGAVGSYAVVWLYRRGMPAARRAR
jgi:hypothetical protein